MFLSCGFSLPLRSRLLAGPRARDVPGPYPGRGRARRRACQPERPPVPG